MGKGFDLGDYVEVPERITRFYERYPEGRIAEVGLPQVVSIGAKNFIGVTVAVYRDQDDRRPCIGTAWEPFPGTTSFTKDSEMMNAATSAIGRALVAAGILAKAEKIASREEVRSRQQRQPGERSGAVESDEKSVQQPASQGAHETAPAGIPAPSVANGTPPRGGDGAAAPKPPADSGAPSPASSQPTGELAMDILYALGEEVRPKQNRLQIDALVRHHGYGVIKERLEKALAG